MEENKKQSGTFTLNENIHCDCHCVNREPNNNGHTIMTDNICHQKSTVHGYTEDITHHQTMVKIQSQTFELCENSPQACFNTSSLSTPKICSWRAGITWKQRHLLALVLVVVPLQKFL